MTDYLLNDQLVSDSFSRELLSWNQPLIRSLPPESRDSIAKILASSINSQFMEKPSDERFSHQIKNLFENGFVHLNTRISDVDVASIVDYFVNMHCYNVVYHGHVKDDGVGRLPFEGGDSFHYGSYPFEVVARAPHLMSIFTSDEVLAVVEGYLGAPATLHSINVFWSFPQPDSHSMGQNFHRDKSHVRFCTLFIYLTDTDESSGAHEYFRFSHNKEQLLAAGFSELIDHPVPLTLFNEPNDGYGFDDIYLSQLNSLKEVISGAAGQMFIEDNYGLHRGVVPRSKPRLLAWARYSLHAIAPEHPKISEGNLGSMLSSSNRGRYAMRAMVKYD